MFPPSFPIFLASLLASLCLIRYASASPLHPDLKRNPRSGDILQMHADQLLHTADCIKQSTEALRTDYCQQLGFDENNLIRPEQVSAPFNDLPESKLFEPCCQMLSDQEIIRLYMSDLTTYKQVLTEIIRIEAASNVMDRMNEIVENVDFLIERLIEVEKHLNNHAASTTQSTPLVLSQRNPTGVVYVLQEFTAFMTEARGAWYVFSDRHNDD